MTARTLMLTAGLAAAALAQEAGDVQKLVARIDARDPAASFDAIGRLVELPPAAKPGIEAAAAKLPEDASFHRAMLLDELKAREELRDKYAPVTRVSVDAKDRPASLVLDDILQKAGERIDTAYAFRGQQPKMTLKLDDVPYLEALRSFCREAKLRLHSQWSSPALWAGGEPGPSFQYRNFLMELTSVQRSREIEFGRPARRFVTLRVTVHADARADIAGNAAAERIEALDDQGRRVEQLPKEDEEPTEPDAEERTHVDNSAWFSSFAIVLRPPEKGVQKLARVRGALPVLVPTATSRFAFAKLEQGETQSDDHYEVTFARVLSSRRQTEVVLRVRPKASLDEFVKTRVALLVKADDGVERRCYASGKVAEGAVEYFAQRYATGEEQMQRRTPKIESVVFLVYRATARRMISFEFRDVPLE